MERKKRNKQSRLRWEKMSVPDPSPDNPPQVNGQVKYPDGKPYYFYVLYCGDGTLYGGFTNNVGHRLAQHRAGKGAKYTKPKSRHPLQLAYYQRFTTKHAALSAEYLFKHQARSAKEAFLRSHGVDLAELARRLDNWHQVHQ
mgnify:CR=1 FL=1